MEYFKIELEGNHFIESYLVYVIEISTSEHAKYFYIGQTGDRNHFTARPAFRRLSAHLSDQGRSTENQLYRHIAGKILKHRVEKHKVFNLETKSMVATFLKKAKICMHAFPIRRFDISLASEHKTNRQFVESIENEVIFQLSQRYGSDFVLNERLPKEGRKQTREAVEFAQHIIKTALP